MRWLCMSLRPKCRYWRQRASLRVVCAISLNGTAVPCHHQPHFTGLGAISQGVLKLTFVLQVQPYRTLLFSVSLSSRWRASICLCRDRCNAFVEDSSGFSTRRCAACKGNCIFARTHDKQFSSPRQQDLLPARRLPPISKSVVARTPSRTIIRHPPLPPCCSPPTSFINLLFPSES